MKFLCHRMFLLVLSLSLIAITVIGGRTGRAAISPADSGVAEPFADKPQHSVVAGFDFSNLDRNAQACQDFNQFASGGWMAKNPIPGAYSDWGRFTQLDDQNLEVLHQILDGLLKSKTPLKGNEEKIADLITRRRLKRKASHHSSRNFSASIKSATCSVWKTRSRAFTPIGFPLSLASALPRTLRTRVR